MSLRPLRSWLPLGAVLCLSLPALTWAKAPPPVKAVKLTQTEEESLMDLEALWGGCENRQLAEGQLFHGKDDRPPSGGPEGGRKARAP